MTNVSEQTLTVTEHERGFAINLMQHLVVPTFVIGADGRVIIWNHACERLTGVPAERVLGTREHWRAFYSQPRPCLADLIAQGRAAEIAAFYTNYDSHSSNTEGFHAENWCVMPQAGSRLYLAVDAGPIFDSAGALLAVVETLRDMTAQKEAQTALEQLAAKDALTDLANRRAFDEALAREWRRAQRKAHSLSLVMLDVDYFKRYNDSYGHQCGDECLRSVARALGAAVVRAGDLAARYGGEEFALILPATGLQGARVVAERVRAAVQALGLPHCASEVAECVTASVGAASVLPAASAGPEALLAAADAALYQAKRAGRNRVVTVDLGT